MKNATRSHQGEAEPFLKLAGCTSIRLEGSGLIAMRPNAEGRSYPVHIEIYEEPTSSSPKVPRFRVRVARQFGLPTSSHHGDSVRSALAAVRWQDLDRPLIEAKSERLAGVF